MAIENVEAYVEALRGQRERLNREAESIRLVVEQARSALRESEQALERAIARVDEIDGELREAKGG